MFRGQLAHRDPQLQRRCIYWLFAAQAKPARFESAGARNRSLISRGVSITPPIVGPFCRAVGAQPTSQPLRAE